MNSKKLTLLDRVTNIFKGAISQCERDAAALAAFDMSPEIETPIFEDLFKETCNLNLETLAQTFTISGKNRQLMLKVHYDKHGTPNTIANKMAIAFETGRRYSIMKISAMLQEEAATLHTAPIEPATGPKLVN